MASPVRSTRIIINDDTLAHDPQHATFRNLSWTINDDECWCILSDHLTDHNNNNNNNRHNLIQLVQAQVRVHPTSSLRYPILDTLPPIKTQGAAHTPKQVKDIVSFVSFKTRLKQTGDFDDYTARYFHIRQEDQQTLEQHLKQSCSSHVSNEMIKEMARMIKIDDLLDLPLVTLSNGQTRRARILRALLSSPELLILEEPFTGLDVDSRPQLIQLLTKLHHDRKPRILWILRAQDELPDCVTHVALLGSKSGEITLGTKDEILKTTRAKELLNQGILERQKLKDRQLAFEQARTRRQQDNNKQQGKVLVELKHVNVAYGPRRVLEDINWTIRQGDKWLLSGHNGSGKSTLLSVILGDHPRSFMEDLTLFGKPRIDQATSTIQANIGHVSPEIANAFPRRYGETGLTAFESIVTGFDSVFCYRKSTPEQDQLVQELISSLNLPELLNQEFLNQLFVELSPGQQSLILLMRALVKKPKLLILDEPFVGMNQRLIDQVKFFLNNKLDSNQALILISHFQEEVPDSVDRLLTLKQGKVVERV
ncbi:hypothetical protein OIO90_000752 [Microbotryomycetes sp. JL221]|nr:hypothetical protein OIO90_000752 [Microbotryomycetes sp. JL221]